MLQKEPLTLDVLAATLAEYDVHYLRVPKAGHPWSGEPPGLISAMAQHPLPRARETLIPLFLRHPEFARYVPELVSALPSEASMMLRHMYTAAVYLQYLWRGKLEYYLGSGPMLPDFFGQSDWNLPPPTKHHGEAGLRTLAERFRSETGFNWLSTYQAVISLFLKELRLKAND
jgi:hypothetical protein